MNFVYLRKTNTHERKPALSSTSFLERNNPSLTPAAYNSHLCLPPQLPSGASKDANESSAATPASTIPRLLLPTPSRTPLAPTHPSQLTYAVKGWLSVAEKHIYRIIFIQVHGFPGEAKEYSPAPVTRSQSPYGTNLLPFPLDFHLAGHGFLIAGLLLHHLEVQLSGVDVEATVFGFHVSWNHLITLRSKQVLKTGRHTPPMIEVTPHTTP